MGLNTTERATLLAPFKAPARMSIGVWPEYGRKRACERTFASRERKTLLTGGW
jgi:hypothetical protein